MRLYIIGILARILGIIIPLLLGVAFLVLVWFVFARMVFKGSKPLFPIRGGKQRF